MLEKNFFSFLKQGETQIEKRLLKGRHKDAGKRDPKNSACSNLLQSHSVFKFVFFFEFEFSRHPAGLRSEFLRHPRLGI